MTRVIHLRPIIRHIPNQNKVHHNRLPTLQDLALVRGARLQDIPKIAILGKRIIRRRLDPTRPGAAGPRTDVAIRALLAGGDILVEGDPIEDLVCRLGLVVRHGVTGVEDAGEGETADLSCPAADVGAVRLDLGVAGFGEDATGDGVGVDVEGDLFAAEPVALVVSVAVDEGCLGPVVEEAADGCEAVAEEEVARLLEGLRWGPS
jgi:hypothetical protein